MTPDVSAFTDAFLLLSEDLHRLREEVARLRAENRALRARVGMVEGAAA